MVVIQGNAFASSHEEIVRAHQLKLDVVSYNDFLGQIIDQYTSVAVTGAHGKTSTTGLLSHVMNGDKKTSFLIRAAQVWDCLKVIISLLRHVNIDVTF